MSRREIGWFVAAALLALVASASAPPAFPGPSETPQEQPTTSPEVDTTVESILRQQEEIMQGRRFSYDPGGRRDPFQSLFTNVQLDDQRKRRPGVQGMLISEIDLKGIVRDTGTGDVAYVTGSDSKGYFLRVGDEVYDGTIIAIDAGKGTVTFRQQVDDPRRIKPYRDVVRRLVPSDEETRNE